MPTTKARRSPNRPANVLAFDPESRRSSRRLIEEGRALEQCNADAKAEADALGLTDQDLAARPDFYYLAHVADEQAAQLTALSAQYSDGHETGLEDARLVARPQAITR